MTITNQKDYSSKIQNWKLYEFKYPLEVEFSDIIISEGKDWIEDCETSDCFGLNPVCFESKMKYDAAFKLCQLCAGWYSLNEEETKKAIEITRKAFLSKQGEPMFYYDTVCNQFYWIDALRENNEKYARDFLGTDSLWSLFSDLELRSVIEKSNCFEWFVDFFGDTIEYDERCELANSYAQQYNQSLEIVLYLRPEQASILIDGPAKVSGDNLPVLASAAAGLIRYGEYELGTDLYQAVFDKAWEEKTTVETKQNIIKCFMDRLSKGYESGAYLDDETAKMLELQCAKFSDQKWAEKTKLLISRNLDK